MPNITELSRSEGFLYLNPTSLADPAGYGTNVGYTVSGVDAYTNEEVFYSTNEESGNNIWRKFYLGNRPTVLTLLRSYNASALAIAGQGHNSGTTLTYPGNRSVGDELSGSTSNLIFIPTNLAYPCVYIRYASVQMYPGAAISFGHSQYTVYPAQIDCLTKSNSTALKVGLIGDIGL